MLSTCVFLASIVQTQVRDVALVIAAQDYGSGILQLQGPRNDAEAIGQTLKGLGFSVSFVGTKGASGSTKEEIEKALAHLGQVSRSGAFRRFVFYYAGHGSLDTDGAGSREYVLLPEDFDASNGRTLPASELRQAVKSIQAQSKTLVLDACFSGAIAKSANIVSRYVEIGQHNPRREKGPVSRRELFDAVNRQSSSDIVVIAATSDIQPAVEFPIGGDWRGLFSYSLERTLKSLSGKSDGLPAAESLLAEVRATMVKVLDSQKRSGVVQTPDIYPKASGSNELFGAGTGVTIPTKDLLALFLQDKPGKLRIEAPKQRVAIGEVVSLTIPKGEGRGAEYACILGKRGDRLYRLGPSFDGEPYNLNKYWSGGPELSFTEPGHEVLRMFVFKDLPSFEAFYDLFPLPDLGSVPFKLSGLLQGQFSRDVDVSRIASAVEATASITFEVYEGLIGEDQELPREDIKRSIRLLMEAPKSENQLLNSLGSQVGQLIFNEASCPYFSRMLELYKRGHDGASGQFLALVNRVLSKFNLSVLVTESLVNQLPPELQSECRALQARGSEIQTLGAKSMDQFLRFNVALFKFIFCRS